MRSLIVSVLTSLDGYFPGPGKDLSSMPFEDAFETHNHELGLITRPLAGNRRRPGRLGQAT
ncbi:hypothetical protein [Microbacterium sp.]|uniref:hypothetical protein n=1 Tax=Microbacterium sp. TaxID=51671 RepID=UPI00333F4D8C